MKNGLKECPFCGKDDQKLMDRFDFTNGAKKKYSVLCSDCGAQTKDCDSSFEAIDCWNMRNGKRE